MESDSDLLEDEVEILVYVEFSGTVSNSTLTKEDLQLDMIGIDTDHPIMQINGRFYEGIYQDAIGTYMFFEKDGNPVVDDSIFDQVSGYKYFAKARKILKMQRIFVKQRTEVLGDSDHQKCIPNMDTIKESGVPPKYQNEALLFWKNIRDERINALSAYLEKQRIREEKKSQGIIPESESDEDNPFAMYKYKEEAKNTICSGNMLKDTQISYLNEDILESTLIDQTLNSDLNFANSQLTHKTTQVSVESIQTDFMVSCEKAGKVSSTLVNSTEKNGGIVKMLKKKRHTKRVLLKKKKRSSVNVGDKPLHNTNVLDVEASSSGASKEYPNTASYKLVGNLQNVSSTTEDSTSVANVNDKTETEMDNKKIKEKNARMSKREAKMKEISERLKSLAEEYIKTRADQK